MPRLGAHCLSWSCRTYGTFPPPWHAKADISCTLRAPCITGCFHRVSTTGLPAEIKFPSPFSLGLHGRETACSAPVLSAVCEQAHSTGSASSVHIAAQLRPDVKCRRTAERPMWRRPSSWSSTWMVQKWMLTWWSLRCSLPFQDLGFRPQPWETKTLKGAHNLSGTEPSPLQAGLIRV